MSGHTLVVGEALVDIVREPDGTEREYCGGSPANVAVTLGRLGRDCRFVTSLADDPRGSRVRAWLTESGARVSASHPANGRTSTAQVTLDPSGGAVYDFDLSWGLDEVDPAGADTVHVGSVGITLSPGAETVRDTVRRARSQAVISLDPNIRPALMRDSAFTRGRIEELVALADVVKVSDEDLAWFRPGSDPMEVARQWAGTGPGLVVVTRGGRATGVLRPDGSGFEVEGRRVRVVDTVGAGDTFSGALIDALNGMGVRGPEGGRRLRELSDAAVRRAVRVAAAAASVTVSRPGADPPDRAELAAALGPVSPPTAARGPGRRDDLGMDGCAWNLGGPGRTGVHGPARRTRLGQLGGDFLHGAAGDRSIHTDQVRAGADRFRRRGARGDP